MGKSADREFKLLMKYLELLRIAFESIVPFFKLELSFVLLPVLLIEWLVQVILPGSPQIFSFSNSSLEL
jgi:hypothetical protein